MGKPYREKGRCEECGRFGPAYVAGRKPDGSRCEKQDDAIAGCNEMILCRQCLGKWLAESD